MKNTIFKLAVVYLIWILFWIGIAQIDPEYGISGFFYLTITGLPLSVFGWDIYPNGGVTSLLIVGTLGLFQWVFVILFVKVLKMKASNEDIRLNFLLDNTVDIQNIDELYIESSCLLDHVKVYWKNYE